jgi:hypothetical protein
MSQAPDVWYIRFPDGRILRAISTQVVRHQLGAGRIPLESTVRRSPEEEWIALEWTEEFSDLVEAASEQAEPGARRRPGSRPAASGRAAHGDRAVSQAARTPAEKIHTVGVAAMFHELVVALDTTLVRDKLLVIGVAGLALGLLPVLAWSFDSLLPAGWSGWLIPAVGGLFVGAVSVGLLTRLAHIELSRVRAARWRDGLPGLGGLTLRLLGTQGLVLVVVAALITGLHWLPGWLLGGEFGGMTTGRDAMVVAAVVVGQVLEVALWAVLIFSQFLAPILVVEACSAGAALGHWSRLLREDLGRVVLYEVLALGLGLVLTLPLTLPLLAASGWVPDERLSVSFGLIRGVLTSLVLAPLLGYLAVAHVFMYLNLRYGFAGHQVI